MGRENGLKILNNISKFKTYNKTRNELDTQTTHLSAYLKFGNISVREAYEKIKSKLGLNSDLLRQIIWRRILCATIIPQSSGIG